ncbi:MAG: hypothetical protein L6282_08560 [Candidatus Methanoperedenaceae archaeon]|nr:hypothetical protein [Candidatus Methanoperedenaceae archaeon]
METRRAWHCLLSGALPLARFPARHDDADVTQGQIWRQGRACLVKS